MEQRTQERLVRPRVIDRARDDAEPVRIEDALERRLARGERGVVRIVGPPGAGKRMAVAYVRSWAAARIDVRAGDDPATGPVLRVVASVRRDRERDELELAPWGRDEWIEYLLARHRAHCAGVMARLERPEEELTFAGRPLLWAAILDELARDPDLTTAYDALRAAVCARFSTAAAHRRAQRACWNALSEPHSLERIAPEFRLLDADEPLVAPFLMQSCVHVMLAAEHVTGELATGDGCALPLRTSRELLRAAGPLLRSRPTARGALVSLLAASSEAPVRATQASAASLLHLYGPSALAEVLRASAGRLPLLSGAELESLEAQGLELLLVRLDEAHLARAHLDGADLRRARLGHADLRWATLCGAKLAFALARAADLTGADLRGAVLDDANFAGARLDEARLESACLCRAQLDGASLRGTLLDRADLGGANLRGATLAGASLVETNLDGAALDGVDLREARLETSHLASASLARANLEQKELVSPDLSGADLSDALLTGSRFRHADLRGARLAGAGLAHVSWPGANLAHADLSHASFHLGTSRSGLVPSAPVSWGTRTGFYAEGELDRDLAPPEEVRKADLRRADLRGARIDETDFYLVDLRGAHYSSEQERHLRACGAIL